MTFHEALEAVESLPDYQQEDLIELIRKRRLERRREALLEDIKEAQSEYERGECRAGTVEDLMKEIDEGEGLSGVRSVGWRPRKENTV